MQPSTAGWNWSDFYGLAKDVLIPLLVGLATVALASVSVWQTNRANAEARAARESAAAERKALRHEQVQVDLFNERRRLAEPLFSLIHEWDETPEPHDSNLAVQLGKARRYPAMAEASAQPSALNMYLDVVSLLRDADRTGNIDTNEVASTAIGAVIAWIYNPEAILKGLAEIRAKSEAVVRHDHEAETAKDDTAEPDPGDSVGADIALTDHEREDDPEHP